MEFGGHTQCASKKSRSWSGAIGAGGVGGDAESSGTQGTQAEVNMFISRTQKFKAEPARCWYY